MPQWQQTGSTGHAYADWEAGLAGAGAGQQIVPVFLSIPLSGTLITVTQDENGALNGSLGPLQALLEATSGIVARHEVRRLRSELRAALRQGLTDWQMRVIGFFPRAQLPTLDAHPALSILRVGPPVEGLPATDVPLDGLDELGNASSTSLPPVSIVIDDGLPFLHRRLRKNAAQTRLAGIWLQTSHDSGRVLDAAEIDQMIASGEEAAAYRAVNAGLLPVNERHSTGFHISHGAAVIDTACGADFADHADRMQDIPVIGVQLPAMAVADTSGRRNEGKVVEGLRWAMAQALLHNRPLGTGPLVATLTLGSLAGPGDETQFLADWLAYEHAAYRMICGERLHVVSAYGNAHRDRLAARAAVTNAAPMQVDWRVQPEDYSPSFVEIRASADTRDGLTLRLEPPVVRCPAVQIGWGSAAMQMVDADGAPIAALYPIDTEQDAGWLIALAPTARHGAGPVAPAGAWQITVDGSALSAGAEAKLSLHVQRDDTPAGYRVLGRQSWLDHPDGWDWDSETRDWTAPEETSPITRNGTGVAHAAANQSAYIEFVGAVRPRTGAPDARVSAIYSSEGIAGPLDPSDPAPDSTGPTLAALSDDSVALPGRRSIGVLSGSTGRLSGTSIAAPALARVRLLRYLHGQEPATGPELAPILSDSYVPQDTRKGHGILAGQEAYSAASDIDVDAILAPPNAMA